MCLPDLRLLDNEVQPRRAGCRPDGDRLVPEPAGERSTRLDARDEAGPSSTPPGGMCMAAEARLKQQQQRHGGRCLVPEHASLVPEHVSLVPEHASSTAELGTREEDFAEEVEAVSSVSEGPDWGTLLRISEDGSSREEGGGGESGGYAGDVPLGQR